MRLLTNRKLNIVVRAQVLPSYLGLIPPLPLISYKTDNRIFKICVLLFLTVKIFSKILDKNIVRLK